MGVEAADARDLDSRYEDGADSREARDEPLRGLADLFARLRVAGKGVDRRLIGCCRLVAVQGGGQRLDQIREFCRRSSLGPLRRCCLPRDMVAPSTSGFNRSVLRGRRTARGGGRRRPPSSSARRRRGGGGRRAAPPPPPAWG